VGDFHNPWPWGTEEHCEQKLMYTQSHPLAIGSIVARTEIAGPSPLIPTYFKVVFSIFRYIPHRCENDFNSFKDVSDIMGIKRFWKRKRLFQVDQPEWWVHFHVWWHYMFSSYVDSLTDQHWSIVYQTTKDTKYPLMSFVLSYVNSLTDRYWSIVYQTMKDTKYPPNELCMDGNATHCVKSHCFKVGFDWLDLIYRWNKETTLFLISVVITIHCFDAPSCGSAS
jgi:hypothetical protein